VGVAVAAIAWLGNVATAWSFSAFSVLIYYGVTNVAALRLSAGERMFAPLWARVGLVACFSLAFAVDRCTWITGLAVLGAGLAWHSCRRQAPPHHS
jgi:APA family basic amino acid/polyamine antiporter